VFRFLFLALALLCACNPHRHEHHYLYFEEAIDAYYRAPRRPVHALSVMKEACQSFPEERDLSCFNYGLLLEWEGKRDQALQAYEAAYRLRPDQLYREAARNSGQRPVYSGRRSQTLSRLLELCKQGNAIEALALGREAELTRPMLETEPLKSCLAALDGYAGLLASLPGDDRPLSRMNRDFLAKKAPLYPFWEGGQGPVARAWQNYQARRSPATLQKFYEALALVAGTDPERQAMALGFRRAAAALGAR